MLTAHKLLFLIAMALTAIALAAPSALAQEHEPVEVSDEDTLAHCNPCTIHLVGESFGVGDTPETDLYGHVFGIEALVMMCEEEFEGEFYEDGEGHITDFELTGGPSNNCTRQPCDSVAEAEWPAHIEEVHPSGALVMNLRFCLEPIGGGTETHCDISLDVVDTGDHDWEAAAFDATEANNAKSCDSGPAEVEGMWDIEVDSETHDDIEITHPPF